MSFFEKLFGSFSTKELKKIQPIADRVLALEARYQAMTDRELQAMTPALRERLAGGETLDDILPDAFAVCREASWRVLGMKHFPVQVVGGIVLHRACIAEMKTGEGKTLVATLPVYLNALTGKGVHVVTVNDYLAKRDSEWMGKLYKFLGLSVGLIIHGVTGEERRAAYNADITYGTNNEFGFDYLRDNMVTYKEQMVQRGHYYAIADEVDSILIDEARTPLIISGEGDKSTDLYKLADNFAKGLKATVVAELDDKEDQDEQVDGDYVVDEKKKTATLTASGIAKAEKYFNVENLADGANMTLQHHINQAIKARGVMKRDVDYVVRDGEVIIVDEFTGRLMLGRRYNEGLHQAIEAKEGVTVARESRTLATITFQNYFRMYEKLSGMTGTAQTEAAEFEEIYGLQVVEVPTNKPVARTDYNDVVYKTEPAKFNAVIEQIIECHEKGQPVLVGTISIEKSELLSKLLSRRGVKHEVLNAKHHEKEAEIVAQAGKKGAVTIATNMAGRGTDIMLGGNAEYLALSEKYKKEKAFSRTAIGILIFLLAVMAVVLVNLLLHRREADRDDLDEDDTMDDGVSEHDDTEELLDENQDDVIEEPEKDSRKKWHWKKRSAADAGDADEFDEQEEREEKTKTQESDDDAFDDAFDEDDIEEEEPPKKRFGFWKRKSDDLDDDLFDDDDAYEDDDAYGDDDDTYGDDDAYGDDDDTYGDSDAPDDEKEKVSGGKDQKNKQDDELDIIDFNDL